MHRYAIFRVRRQHEGVLPAAFAQEADAKEAARALHSPDNWARVVSSLLISSNPIPGLVEDIEDPDAPPAEPTKLDFVASGEGTVG